MRIAVLQHVAFESPGWIADWAAARGHALGVTRLFADDRLPGAGAFDALVIMGGPMSVHDEARHAWLLSEQRLIGDAIRAEKHVLGVCLGAQMIAHVLGARVYRNREREIGWFPVMATEAGVARYRLPVRFDAFHWHGEAFDLPAGAVPLARTDACVHQMFVAGERVLGLQFHLEVTRDGIADLIRHGAADLAPGPFVQPADEMLAPGVDFAAAHRLLASLLDRWSEGGGR